MKKYLSLLAILLLIAMSLSVFASCDDTGTINQIIDEVTDAIGNVPSASPTESGTGEPSEDNPTDPTPTDPTPTDPTPTEPTPTEPTPTEPTPTEPTPTEPTPTEPPVITPCDHKDTDNNGYCDECEIYVIIDFNLFGINDLHGKLSDSDSQPGVDEMTAYLMNAKNNMDNTLIFSSGDMWQGTAESGLTFGNMMTEWMNYLDFEFMTVGNHEFDWGDKYISENLELARFPFLAINIYDSDTNRRADFCDSSVMVDLGEIQIGFIGAIGDCYSSISGEMSEGYYFKTGNELSDLIMAESEYLREQGADFIVLSIHDSTSGYDSGLSSGGYVDIVFEGHSHSRYVTTDAYGVYHLQGGGDNSSGLSYACVSYNFANDNHTVKSARTVYHSEMAGYGSSDIVDELWEKYSEQTSMINTVLGYNNGYRDGDELKSVIATLYTNLASSQWSDYNIVLGGGYLSCRSPGYLAKGDVTYGDLYTLFPFNNRLALCSCSGQDLLKNYINNSNYFTTFTEYGLSVIDSIDITETYYIITDSYNYTYKRNNLTVIEYYDETVFARDLLADYIKNGGFGTNTPEPPSEPLTPNKYYTFEELTKYGKTLADNEDTGADMFYSAGKITSILGETYGNMLLVDNEGNTFMIYGLYSSDGSVRFDAMTDKPEVGDTILVYGKIKKYVNSNGEVLIEFVDARLMDEPVPDSKDTSATIPQLIALCMSLDGGAETSEKYYFVGKIKEIVSTIYGNCYVTDENGNEFYVYGIYQNGDRYDSLGDIQPHAGDTVMLYGKVKHYVNSSGETIFEMISAELILE